MMQTKMTPAHSIYRLVSSLFDVKSRINDWLAAGGNLNDEYMWMQVRYIENIAKRMGELGGSL